MEHMRKLSRVQTAFVPVREAGPDYLVLERTPGLPPRECCAVLEVSGLNYLLKSEEEQRLINDVFRIILASLTHPLQVLMRVQPFDLARYLSCFQSETS